MNSWCGVTTNEPNESSGQFKSMTTFSSELQKLENKGTNEHSGTEFINMHKTKGNIQNDINTQINI
jgi:hypothetical protein